MIRWIRKLLGLCNHSWDDVEQVNVYKSSSDEWPRSAFMRQRCNKCGDYRKIDL